MQEERALPRSLEAERAVLGGLMLDPQRVPLVSEHLTAMDFYRESHQKLFELMVRMTERDEPTEMVAVVEQISKTGEAEAFGGLSYVSALPDNVPSLENLEYYAKLVRERAVARRLIFAAQGITSAVLDGKEDLTDLLDKAESSIFEVTQSNERRDWVALSQVVDSEFLRIQELSENPKDVTGCTTGYKLLDDMLSGFQPSELVILAARPSMGKTALALNIAQNAAMEGGVGVGVFSLEMSAEQLGTRLLCSHARLDAGKVRTGQLSRDEDWPKLVQAAEELYQVPIFVDDTPALTVNQIRSKARRLATQRPDLGLIVIDYIGMMAGDPRVSRQEQVSASSRGLKALAKELGITVLCLSQLNRGVEQRPNKRPQLSDLRESGAIEQDADVIMFIYRDEYYNKENTTEPGVGEIIIAKQRNGPTGRVKLAWVGKYTRFDNLAVRPDADGYH